MNPETKSIVLDKLNITPLYNSGNVVLTVNDIKENDVGVPLFKFNEDLDMSRLKFIISDGDYTPTAPLFFSSNVYSYVHIVNCSFERDASYSQSYTSVPLSSSVIYFEGYSARLSYCVFNNIELLNSSFVCIKGSLTITGCNITNINIKNGNGSALNVSNSHYCCINNTNFHNCSCLNGNGGAVYLLLDGDWNATYEMPIYSSEFKYCCASTGNSYYRNSNNNNEYNNINDGFYGYGGALYVLIRGRISFDINPIFGSGDEKNSAIVANNLFIESDYFEIGWKSGDIRFMSESLKGSDEYMFCSEGEPYDFHSLIDLYIMKI